MPYSNDEKMSAGIVRYDASNNSPNNSANGLFYNERHVSGTQMPETIIAPLPAFMGPPVTRPVGGTLFPIQHRAPCPPCHYDAPLETTPQRSALVIMLRPPLLIK